jgi:iron(III) transport system substrate-binding protein
MRLSVLAKMIGCFTLFSFLALVPQRGDGASPAPLFQAKKEAETKGYSFFATHEEIVTMAKKEEKLGVSSNLEPQNFKPLINAFKQRYPFITDVQVGGELSGGAAYQRLILEMKSGQAKEWDVTHIPLDFAQEYPPYLLKHDILGMAKQGVLKIDPRMVSPVERNMITITSNVSVILYNRRLISDDKVPATWDDFLKPEFKAKKFLANIRPLHLAGLVPAWGLERTLDFARKLAAQQPVWGSGTTRLNTAVAAGEHSLYLASNFSSAKRAMSKDATGNLNYRVLEPIPTRIVEHTSAIINTASHPHAALLWLEFLASPEGQEIIDKYEPLRASIFTPGSATEQVTRGKKLSVVDWNHFSKYQDYEAKIFAAWGFPKEDTRR